MLKLVFVALSMGICTLAGFRFSGKYDRREKYFGALNLFCTELKCEIGFSHKKLHEICTQKAQSMPQNLGKNMCEFSECLTNGYVQEGELFARLSKNDLTPQELDLMAQFLGSLGKSDSLFQEQIISAYQARFLQLHETASVQNKKYGALLKKLGVMCGLFVSVLII